MLHLYIQSFAQHTRSLGTSSACLFVDIKQAFYRASRQLLLHREITDSTIVQLFAAHGWSPDMYKDFRVRLAEAPALTQAHVSTHQIAQVDDMLSATWFQVKANPQTLTYTGCGTRPGDSVADLLYGFLMARFIHALREQMLEFGLATPMELQWIPGSPVHEGEIETQQLIEACWVDDLVLLLQANQPEVLVQKIQAAARITQDLAVSFGLALNYGPDKTAVLAAFRGPHAKQVLSQILDGNPGRPQIEFPCQSLPQGGVIDLVPNYIYLGQLQDQQGHPGCEVKRRFLLIQATSRILRKNIFKSPKMPLETRRQLFRSLVLSKLVYGAGAWQATHIHTARSWHSQIMTLYSQIVARVSPAPHHYHLDTLAHCDLPHPMLLLTHQKASLFERLMAVDMGELLALLQAQNPSRGWFHDIMQDLQRLAQTMPEHPLFDINDPADLASLCVHNRNALSRLLKAAHKHYSMSLRIWKDFRTFQNQFETAAHAYGLQWTVETGRPSQPAVFECPACGSSFPTYKALCTHTYKKHAEHNVVQRYTASNTCRACMKMYHSRQQVIHHLKYMKTGCLLQLIATVMPLSDEKLAQVLHEDREHHALLKRQARSHKHKHPMCLAAGPKRPSPWDSLNCLSHTDTRDFPEIAEERLQQVLCSSWQHDVSLTLEFLQEMPFHGRLLSRLVAEVEAQCPHDSPEECKTRYTLQTAFRLWADDPSVPLQHTMPGPPHEVVQQMLEQIRAPHEHLPSHDLPVDLRRTLLVDQLWLEDSVQWQLRHQMYRERSKVYIAVVPRPISVVQNAIFVYVFSGRRRVGDFQSHLETIMRARGISGRVLQLDLAISEKHDVGDPALLQMLLRWIESGCIAGLLIAPPCETWSQARNIEPREPTDPRPLRSAEDPFGLQRLTLAEMEQLVVSSFLLYTTLRLLLATAVHQVPSILEHPAEPRLRCRASIWRLPWLMQFEKWHWMRRYKVWQGELGAHVPKPTHFGTFHVPCFQQVLEQYKVQPDWTALTRLGGKDSSGQWKTSSAKEYPPLLNCALADALVTAHEQQQQREAAVTFLPTEVEQEFQAVYAGDVDPNLQELQPDFHRRNVNFNLLD